MGRSVRRLASSDNQQAEQDDRDSDVGVERNSGIVRGPVVRDDDLADVNDGVAELPHGVANYGGQPEVVAEPVAEDAEHTNGEVGDGDLGLEGVAGGPADRHRGGVRPDRVCEEDEHAADADGDDQQPQQQNFGDMACRSRLLVAEQVDGSDDQAEDEKETGTTWLPPVPGALLDVQPR
jgi:hypothetical protein